MEEQKAAPQPLRFQRSAMPLACAIARIEVMLSSIQCTLLRGNINRKKKKLKKKKTYHEFMVKVIMKRTKKKKKN